MAVLKCVHSHGDYMHALHSDPVNEELSEDAPR